MSEGLVTASYIGAIVLFILTLGGLSHQESARKGNLYGIIGMALAILATVFGPEVFNNIHIIIMVTEIFHNVYCFWIHRYIAIVSIDAYAS